MPNNTVYDKLQEIQSQLALLLRKFDLLGIENGLLIEMTRQQYRCYKTLSDTEREEFLLSPPQQRAAILAGKAASGDKDGEGEDGSALFDCGEPLFPSLVLACGPFAADYKFQLCTWYHRYTFARAERHGAFITLFEAFALRAHNPDNEEEYFESLELELDEVRFVTARPRTDCLEKLVCGPEEQKE
jgi:hypothetical protein